MDNSFMGTISYRFVVVESEMMREEKGIYGSLHKESGFLGI